MDRWHNCAKILELVLLKAKGLARGARATWHSHAKPYFWSCFHADSRIVARSAHAKEHDHANGVLLRAILNPLFFHF